MKTPPKPEFWVTNASDRNVTLADLAINIKAFRTVNLLDKKHYDFTLEQLIKSRESGSIFKKRDKILVRDLPPPAIDKERIPFLRESAIPSRGRSILSIEQVEYDELKISDDLSMQKKLDEDYARENAELADADTQKLVISHK
jgi:hypothetical protein